MMAYTPLKISIPEPCQQDWDEMTPLADNQRHCDQCAKNVTDFSWMTDREILAYLAVAGNRPCGRFRADQLDRSIRAYVPPSTGWRTIAAAGGLLLSAGLSAQVPAPYCLPEDKIPYTTMSMPVNESGEVKERIRGTFSGKVLDESGEPMIGASIMVQETTSGTVTDLDGEFSLSASVGQWIVISYLGYEPLIVPIRNGDPGFTDAGAILTLEPDTTTLGEVIVLGMAVENYLGGAIVTEISITEAPETEAPRENSVTVFPNPFTDRLQATFNADTSGHATAQLFEVNGRLVRLWKPQPFESGRATLEFPLGDLRLIPGHYELRVTDDRGEVFSSVVVRN